VESKDDEAISSIPASDNDKCTVCGEELVKFFDEDLDNWMLRGVIKIKQKVFNYNLL
jgi:hypothetical protein